MLALLLHSQHRREEAVDVLRRAMQQCDVRSAGDAALHYNLALLLLEEGSNEQVLEAVVVLEQGTQLIPSDLDVKCKLGWLLFATDTDTRRGEELLLQVLRAEPGHAAAVVCISRVMQELGGDLEKKLLPVMLEAVRCNSGSALVRREHARLRELLDNLPAAEVEYRKALLLDPSDAAARVGLTRVLTNSDSH